MTCDSNAAFDVIAFDGDDTLWHNERLFSVTQDRFKSLLQGYGVTDIDEELLATEVRNLHLFGYGIKGFILSMIETAIMLTDGRIDARDISALIDAGKRMLDHPVELMDGASEVVNALRDRYRIMVITKGDLFDQESKLARSGLADAFWRIEIVSEKDERTYRSVLDRHDIAPQRFLMVGNSVRSDILPVIAIGGRAVHVPYQLTWVHERAEMDDALEGVWTLESLRELPQLLERIATDKRVASSSKG
jgi:putative hydrolase of the HAD superfamily